MGQRDRQEGALGRGRSAAAGPSVKALINPTWSPEAGCPLEAPQVGIAGPGLHHSHQSLDAVDPGGERGQE